MTDTSLIFNILAKDQASQAFGLLKIKATEAFDSIATRAFDFAKETVAAFETGERSQLLLEDAFAKFPGLADTNIEHLRAYNEQLQTTARYDHNALAEGEAKLAMFKFTGAQIEALTPLMEDFADKTGMGLAESATVFGKAMIGQGRGLKQVGIQFHDTGTEAGNYAELLSSLSDKVGGFAEKEGKTAAGQTAILKNEMEDLKEKIGAGLVPVLLKVVPPLMQILEYLNKNSATVLKVLTVVGSLIGVIWALNAATRAYTAITIAWGIATKAITGAQIALDVAMNANPIGIIIIAVIALVGGIYLLWTHSAGFRSFFIGMWHDIWGVLKAIGAWFAGPFVNFFKDVGAWFAGPFANFFVSTGKAIAAPFIWLWDQVIHPVFSLISRIVTSFANLFIWLGEQAVKPVIAGIKLELRGMAVVWNWLYNSVFVPIGHGIEAVVHGVGVAVSWLHTSIVTPVAQAIGVAVHGVGVAWDWLWSHAIGPAINAIAAAVTWWWGGITAAFDLVMDKVHVVGGVFQTVFAAIGGFIEAGFGNAVGFVKAVINGIIDAIDTAIGGINHIIDMVNKVPGVDFPLIPQIPRLDLGGTILQTGLAVVHKGETVTPAGRGGGAVTITFDVRGADQEMARMLRKMVRVQGAGNVQTAFGN